MRFTKMHGLGNDFVLVNGFTEQLPTDLGALAKTICHRQLGIGADGLLVLKPVVGYDSEFLIFNFDGSQAEMCGNGVRCAALFAKKQGIIQKDQFVFLTLAGPISPTIIDQEQGIVRVNMGEPRLRPEEIPADFEGSRVVSEPLVVGDKSYNVTLVSMGNPHCVIFVNDLDLASFPVEKIGPLIEHHPSFPARINVEFVKLVSDEVIKMRVWERGCGETFACGTGACAAVVSSVLNGFTKSNCQVQLAYGSLNIKWVDQQKVFMTGPAIFVAEGEFFI